MGPGGYWELASRYPHTGAWLQQHEARVMEQKRIQSVEYAGVLVQSNPRGTIQGGATVLGLGRYRPA
jgi:hypothetical protein